MTIYIGCNKFNKTNQFKTTTTSTSIMIKLYILVNIKDKKHIYK
jgi:hypothetical protein